VNLGIKSPSGWSSIQNPAKRPKKLDGLKSAARRPDGDAPPILGRGDDSFVELASSRLGLQNEGGGAAWDQARGPASAYQSNGPYHSSKDLVSFATRVNSWRSILGSCARARDRPSSSGVSRSAPRLGLAPG
jgi:hypothetical protein